LCVSSPSSPPPPAGLSTWLGAALVVVGGAVGMTWLAIALAASAADLSDEQRPAIGPATIYTFLLVGGLYNVVLAGDVATRARGFVLYAFAITAYWLDGVRQATVCLDAEAVRQRRLTLGDGATFLIALALGQRATAAVVAMSGADGVVGTLVANLGVAVAVGLATAIYLARRTAALTARARLGRSAALAVSAGLAAGALCRLRGFPDAAMADAIARQPLSWTLVLPVILAEELLFRGVIQRAVEEAFGPRGGSSTTRGVQRLFVPTLSASVSVLLAVVAAGGVASPPLGLLLVLHGAAALTRAATGRVSAAILTRLAATAAAVAFAHLVR
jgi:membrane protease YdiL (CAAX protease family)